MAGGPGGSGGGVATSSLLWAIVMSAFAGSYIILNLGKQCITDDNSFCNYSGFGGILFGFVSPCRV